MPVVSVSASPGYAFEVFRPNGTKYSVSSIVDIYFENVTSGEVYANESMDINFNFTFISKRIDLKHIGWGFILELPEEAVNETNFPNKISVPPLLAVEEGSRRIYFPQVLFDLIEGRISDVGEALKNVFFSKINKSFYILNPFYISKDVKIGDKVDYGFWYVKRDTGYIVNGEVKEKVKINIAGLEIETWRVEIQVSNLTEVLDVVSEMFNVTLFENDTEAKNVIGNITITANLYYDTKIGWLTKANITAHLNPEAIPEDVTGHAQASITLNLLDFGALNIGGKGIVFRLIGIPDEALLISDIVIIALIVITIIRRRRA